MRYVLGVGDNEMARDGTLHARRCVDSSMRKYTIFLILRH